MDSPAEVLWAWGHFEQVQTQTLDRGITSHHPIEHRLGGPLEEEDDLAFHSLRVMLLQPGLKDEHL